MKIKRSFGGLVLCLGASLSLVFHLISTAVFAQGDAIKVGVSIPITGNAAIWGEDIRRVVMFANEELAGGRYKLVFEDDACDPRTAVSAAHKLINLEQVKYVLGLPCSSALMPAAPLYEKAKVLVVSVAASSASVSDAGDYIFRTWLNDARAVDLLNSHISGRYAVVGALTETTEAAQSLLMGFQQLNQGGNKSAEGSGDGKYQLVNEDYTSDTTNHRAALLRLKSKGIKALFVISQTEVKFAEILKQAKDLKLNVPIYSFYLTGSSYLLNSHGELVEGAIYVDTPDFADVTGPSGAQILSRFKAKYGQMNFSDMLFATTFEAFRAIHQAIQSGQEPRGYLYNTKFNGILGDWSFDKHGDIQGHDFVLKVIRNRKPEKYRP